MWECQHAECHYVQNCAICWKQGATWCPHQKCRYQNAKQRTSTVVQPRSVGAPRIEWTPSVVGNALKVFFAAAAAAGIWWLLRSAVSRPPDARDLLSPDAAAAAPEFSAWEPQS